MGDRALVIFTDGKEVSPVVYLHWRGDEVPAWLEDLKVVMSGREGDVSYSAARFTGICHSRIEGNLSLGLWQTPPHIEAAILTHMLKPKAVKMLIDYSHGDAGVVVVDVKDGSWKAFGGYLVDRETPDKAD